MLYGEFKNRVEEIYHSKFPESLVVTNLGALGQDTFFITMYLAKDKSEFSNGIAMNDIFHISFYIYGANKDYETRNKLTDDTELDENLIMEVHENSITVKPDNDYMAYGFERLPFRKTKGNADKILATLEKYTDVLYNTLERLYNEDKIHSNHKELVAQKLNKNINESKLIEDNNSTITEELNTGLLPIVDVDMYSLEDELVNYDTTQEELDDIVEEIAPEYIEDTLKEILAGVSVKVKSVYHPKQYNFSGDELEFDLSVNAASYNSLKEKTISNPNFESFLKEKYSSHSGFISTMADNLNDFNSEEQWKQMVQVIMFNIPQDELVKQNDAYLDRFLEAVHQNFPMYDDEELDESVEFREFNEEADKLIREYFNHKMSLPELHYRLEKVFGNKKDAVEYFSDNEDRVKSTLTESKLNIEKPTNFEFGKVRGLVKPDGTVYYTVGNGKTLQDVKVNYSELPDNTSSNEGKIKAYIKKNILKESVEEEITVGNIKQKALEILPKEDIDTHESDLYLKVSDKSTELVNKLKDKDNGLLVKFRSQIDGKMWYDIPFANMEDNYKSKITEADDRNYKDNEFYLGDDKVEYIGDIKEDIWTAVCCGDNKFIENAFNKSLIKANTRHHQFDADSSLIMGALRNKNYDTVEVLKSFGETILKDEVSEYKKIMAEKTYEDDVTKSASDK